MGFLHSKISNKNSNINCLKSDMWGFRIINVISNSPADVSGFINRFIRICRFYCRYMC